MIQGEYFNMVVLQTTDTLIVVKFMFIIRVSLIRARFNFAIIILSFR